LRFKAQSESGHWRFAWQYYTVLTVRYRKPEAVITTQIGVDLLDASRCRLSLAFMNGFAPTDTGDFSQYASDIDHRNID
jgi:hypothetical protein